MTLDPDSTQTSTGQAADGTAGLAGDPSARQAGPAVDATAAAGGPSVQERAVTLANERPEVAAGAAFAGGLFLALILKRLAR